MANVSAQDGAIRRAYIESVLAGYPNVDREETELLVRWFRTEATALDVGLIASDSLLGHRYQQFKADHLDRLRGADLVHAFWFVSIVVLAVIGIVWMAPS